MAGGGAAAVCAHCGVASAKLLRCGRCKTAQYCGSKCQAKHYPAHKVVCRAIGAAAAGGAAAHKGASAAEA